MRLTNALTEASGTYVVLPDGRVLMAIPFNDNPQLSDMAVVQQCLREVAARYPRISHFEVSTQLTKDFGYVLQIIVSGA